jgi:Uma2 family endonuclease
MDARHATPDDLARELARELVRHRFTVDEVLAMQEAGVIDGGDYELIDGDLCVVAAKKNDHEIVKRRLNAWLIRNLASNLCVAVEASLFLDGSNAPEPDLMVHADALLPEQVRGADVHLLIEIADQTLIKDLRTKAALYATHGVSLYWVIEAATRRTHVHAGPQADGSWTSITVLEADQPLSVPGADTAILLSEL